MGTPICCTPDARTLFALRKAKTFSRSLGLRGERPAIVSWIVLRLGYKEIACRLERSVGTVEYHVKGIFRQSGTVDREDLMLRVLLSFDETGLGRETCSPVQAARASATHSAEAGSHR